MSIDNSFIRAEKLRDKFAQTKEFEKFLNTYRKSEIKNFNTGIFWDKKFEHVSNYKNLDGVTKDKINYIISRIPNKKSRLLDLGIGQGFLEQKLDLLGIEHSLYGIDISKLSISQMKERFRGFFKVGNVFHSKKYFRKNFFDVIVALELIEHISPDKIFRFYKDVSNLLVRDGIFIVSTPLNEGLENMEDNPSAHVREYTIPILQTEFDIAGFEILNLKTFIAFENCYGIKKIISRCINRWEPNSVVIVARKK